MSGNGTVVMGDRGRLVIPQELRERVGIKAGTKLIIFEKDGGLMVMTRDQLLARVRADLAGGPSLVDELIADRRAEAKREAE